MGEVDPRGFKLQLGQVGAFAKVYDLVANARRKAYGIPDVSKLEFEDKTSSAERHARAIHERREARLRAEAEDTELPGDKVN